MKYISFYTEGVYEDVFNNNLKPSLEKFSLDYYCEKISDQGNWYLNTAFKSTFIKECLDKFKEPVIFIDADAQILEYPCLFERIDCDIAIHWLDWYKFWRNQDNNSKRELLSGTMYLDYNKKVQNLLDKWIKSCYTNINEFEQRKLEYILNNDKHGLDIYDLPVGYCAVVKKDGTIPDYIGKPTIIHTQASRENR